MRTARIPLLWRVFAVNAAVLLAAGLALAFSPATVSHPLSATEGAMLTVGVCITLLVNLVLLRRSFGALRHLQADMEAADLLAPARRDRLRTVIDEPALAALANAYADMRERLAAERRASARRAAEAQEEERRRVARELHDEVGQTLTGLLLRVDQAARELPPQDAEQLEAVREAARRSLEDVRRIARSLRPEVLDDLGLVPALLALVKAFGRATGVRVERRLDPATPRLAPDAELAVYRICQEALTNVARHAGAERVEVRLGPAGDGVQLVVRDDGQGLPPGTERHRGGTGLRSMHERAVLVDARLEVVAPPDGGTIVRLDVPLEAPPDPAPPPVRPSLGAGR